MTGYIRQSVADIVAGNDVDAQPLNNEFNAIEVAFDGTVGHTHDGNNGNGPKIGLTSSVVGILPVANGGTGSATGAGALTNLGVTSYIQTLLDDTTAAAARITLGLVAVASSGSATDLTTGTIADARLPTSMAGKTFTSNVILNASALMVNTDADRGIHLRTAAGLTQAVYGSSGTTGVGYINIYDAAGNFTQQLILPRTGSMTWGGQTVWTAGNDGNGSGLDADLVRGLPPSMAGGANTVGVRRNDGALLANAFVTDGAANIGSIYLGSNGVHYLNFDGSNYNLASGGLVVGGGITSTSGVYSASVAAGQNPSYYCAVAGVSRGLTYYDAAAASMNWNLYSSAGTYVRTASYRESDGQFRVLGYIETTGAIISDVGRFQGMDGAKNMLISTAPGSGIAGAIFFRPDGDASSTGQLAVSNTNITWAGFNLVRADGGTYNINSSGYAQRVRTSEGILGQFHWSGQTGQPNWVWGGNDVNGGQEYYVYNPLNFSVANSAALGGVAASNFAQISFTGTQNDTNFPIGHVIQVVIPSQPVRNAAVTVYLSAGNGAAYTTNSGDSAGTLTGTWRSSGVATGGATALFRRVG